MIHNSAIQTIETSLTPNFQPNSLYTAMSCNNNYGYDNLIFNQNSAHYGYNYNYNYKNEAPIDISSSSSSSSSSSVSSFYNTHNHQQQQQQQQQYNYQNPYQTEYNQSCSLSNYEKLNSTTSPISNYIINDNTLQTHKLQHINSPLSNKTSQQQTLLSSSSSSSSCSSISSNYYSTSTPLAVTSFQNRMNQYSGDFNLNSFTLQQQQQQYIEQNNHFYPQQLYQQQDLIGTTNFDDKNVFCTEYPSNNQLYI
jgi:hypothetical protein